MAFNPLKTGAESRKIHDNLKTRSGGQGGKWQPYRFKIAQQVKNDPEYVPEAVIIVLDDHKDVYDFVSLWEHSLYNEVTKETRTVVCTQETGHCEYCDSSDKKPYYATFATVIDTRLLNVESTKGKYYRKLLAIKGGLLSDFIACAEAHIAKYGTTRGMVLHMKRDITNSKSVSTGVPVEGKNAKIFDGRRWGHMDDALLVKSFSTPAITNQQGQVLAPANSELQPYDYAKIFTVEEPGKSKESAAADDFLNDLPGAEAPKAEPYQNYNEDTAALDAVWGADAQDETGGLPAPGAAAEEPKPVKEAEKAKPAQAAPEPKKAEEADEDIFSGMFG